MGYLMEGFINFTARTGITEENLRQPAPAQAHSACSLEVLAGRRRAI